MNRVALRLVTTAVAVSLLGLATAATAATAGPADAAGAPVTVPAPAGGSVTVDATTGLFDQVVNVSWQGFKPSTSTVVHAAQTEYVVRVYECRGTAPAGPQDCYGSSVYTYPGQTSSTDVLPDGPANYVDAVTAPDGTGSAQIEVRTAAQSATLGCSVSSPCSLAVVPNYGNGTKSLDFLYATNSYMDSAWAWANHVSIPLSFAPTGASCPFSGQGVTVSGSPMMQRAIASWQPAACHGSAAVTIDYTALPEPQARAGFATGTTDVALTTLPAASGAPSSRAVGYAPLAVGGITVSFHVDDAQTGLPITTMVLDARLVAKLLTESYGEEGYVAPGQPVGNGNPATVGNPYCLFTDPEFLKLNPGHSWPVNDTNPLILSGTSDLTWELTSWIAADPDARAFVAGAPDPWGMHVNTHFKGVQFPVQAITLRDPYPDLSYTYVPIDGLDLVARGLVANQPSGSSPTPDQTGQHEKDPQQLPGEQALIAITDSADAAAFDFPNAELVNAAGVAVAPTAAALSAALAEMTASGNGGTRFSDFTAKDPAAYPLTMVQYAMVPTSNAAATTVAAVSRFLAYATGPGQVVGPAPGQLPAGYLPLTPALAAQAKAALAAVVHQSGARPRRPGTPPGRRAGQPPGGGAPPGGGGGTPSGGSSGGGGAGQGGSGSVPGARPHAGPGPGVPAPPAAVTAAVTVRPPRSFSTVMAGLLPVVLALFGAAVLAGPGLVLVGGRGAVARVLPAWARRVPAGWWRR